MIIFKPLRSVLRMILPGLICLLGISESYAQQQIVSGTVYEAASQTPLPGVNIIVKGTQQGTTTDADGSFSINVLANATLIFSFIGYVTQEISAGTQTRLTVSLETDTQA